MKLMSLIDGIGTRSGIVCLDQVHFVVRDSKDKSSNSLLENIALILEGNKESTAVFERIKYKNGSLLNRPDNLPVTDSEGYLKSNDTFLGQLKNVIGNIMNSAATSTSPTSLLQLNDSIRKSIDIVNTWRSSQLSPAEQPLPLEVHTTETIQWKSKRIACLSGLAKEKIDETVRNVMSVDEPMILTLTLFRQNFQGVISDMVEAVLSFESTDDVSLSRSIYSVFGEAMNHTLSTFPASAKDLTSQVKKDVVEKRMRSYLEAILSLQTALTNYRWEMKRRLDLNGCLADDKFNEYHHKYMTISASMLKVEEKEFIQDHFNSGILKLQTKFAAMNMSSRESEHQRATTIVQSPILKDYYNERMTEEITSQTNILSNLPTIHKKVVEEAIQHFITVIAPSHDSGLDLACFTTMIRIELDPLFSEYKTAHDNKVQILTAAVVKASEDQRKAFNQMMEAAFPIIGESTTSEELKEKHHQAKEDVCQLLKLELKQSNSNFDQEGCLQSFRRAIQQDWQHISQENEKSHCLELGKESMPLKHGISDNTIRKLKELDRIVRMSEVKSANPCKCTLLGAGSNQHSTASIPKFVPNFVTLTQVHKILIVEEVDSSKKKVKSRYSLDQPLPEDYARTMLQKHYFEVFQSSISNPFTVTETDVQQAYENARENFLEKMFEDITKHQWIPTKDQEDEIESAMLTHCEDVICRVRSCQRDFQKTLESFHESFQDAPSDIVKAVVDFEFESSDGNLSKSLYEKKLNQTLSILPASAQGLRSQVKDLLEKKTRHILEAATSLEMALANYRLEMKRRLDMNRCLADDKFYEYHQKYMHASSSMLNGDEKGFIQAHFDSGVRKLQNQFSSLNIRYRVSENRNAHNILQSPILKNFYNEAMTEITTNQRILSNLPYIHNEVVGEAIEVFKAVCAFSPDSGMDLTSFSKDLRNELDPLFSKYKMDNALRVQKLTAAVAKAGRHQREVYNEMMEAAFPKRGESTSSSELTKKHHQCVDEVCLLLKLELRKLNSRIDQEGCCSPSVEPSNKIGKILSKKTIKNVFGK
jgi:hypothetical protein